MLAQDVWTAVVAVGLFLIAAALMWWGWSNRIKRQAGMLGPLPELPEQLGPAELGPLTGVYIGTTPAGQWQERIAQKPLGFRSGGEISAHPEGILLNLDAGQIWIPRADIVEVRADSKLANKAVPGQGILVVSWNAPSQDGTMTIDTGFRADDKDSYPQWTALKENS